MAFDYFGQQEEDQQGQQQSQQGQNQQSLGSESPVVTGSEPSSGAKTSSGSFTNLQSYLDANKGLNFGQEVAGKVQNQITGAEKAQQAAATGFKSAADQGSVAKNTDLLNSVRTDATSVVGDQSKKAEFEKMRDASYQGPMNLVDKTELYNPAAQATDKAYQTAQQTKDEGGRKAFLQQEYGSGAGRYGYNSGMQKLDNLLIQQDPGSKQAFAQTQQNAANAKNAFGTMKTDLNQYAQGKKQETAATRKSALDTLGLDDQGNWLNVDGQQGNQGAMQDTLEALDALVAQKKITRDQQAAMLAGTYGKQSLADFTAQQRAMYGLQDSPQYTSQFNNLAYNTSTPMNFLGSEKVNEAPFKSAAGNLFGYNPQAYTSVVDASTLNRSSLADQTTQAKLNALAQLANKDNNFINKDQAGSMVDKALYTADGQKLVGDATTRKTSLQADLQKIVDDVMKAKAQGGLTDPTKVRQQGNAARAKYGLGAL